MNYVTNIRGRWVGLVGGQKQCKKIGRKKTPPVVCSVIASYIHSLKHVRCDLQKFVILACLKTVNGCGKYWYSRQEGGINYEQVNSGCKD